MGGLRARPGLVALVIVVLVGTSAALQAVRDRAYSRSDPRERILYLQSGEALKRLSLSFDALAADLYWIRTLQHFGGDRLARDRSARYELLYPLLDLTTSLDPQFHVAYRFGAIFLSEPPPGGPGRPDLAISLLRKGLRASPRAWELMQDIGFVYYWDLGDFKNAAAWFQRAAQVRGAPDWLEALAATTLASGGDRVSSRFLWQQILASAQEDWMKREAERRLAQLLAMDQVEWLEARVRAYAARRPDSPLTWEHLVRAGVLREAPRDPADTPYQLDPQSGSVFLAEQSRLYPLPTTAAAAARAARVP
jgi:tetratricopeptide (TPR) repeat protein